MYPKNGRAYCIECANVTEYYTQEVDKTHITHDAMRFVWTEVQAICEDCGNEVWVSEIVDENIKRHWDAMHEAYGESLKKGTVVE